MTTEGKAVHPPMRRSDRAIDRESALAIVDKCLYAVLSTVSEDGSPYGTALSIARDGGIIYFHCAKIGHKITNIRRENRVCLFCVGDVTEPPDRFTVCFESACVFGTAEEVTGNEEKIHALRLICERHTQANMANFEANNEKYFAATGVWKINITDITGKRRSL